MPSRAGNIRLDFRLEIEQTLQNISRPEDKFENYIFARGIIYPVSEFQEMKKFLFSICKRL